MILLNKRIFLFLTLLLFSCAIKRDLAGQDESFKIINQSVRGLENLSDGQKDSLYYLISHFQKYFDRFDLQETKYQKYLAEKKLPVFITHGLLIQILSPTQKLTDIPELIHLKGKKLYEVYGDDYQNDKRTMDELTGEGSHRFIAIRADQIPDKIHGQQNTLFHESQIKKLESLYLNAKNKNLFYDDYAGSNSTEYFACSFEAYLSETKTDKSRRPYAEEKIDLQLRDPEMFEFITNIVHYK
jgi:hypothetical protein